MSPISPVNHPVDHTTKQLDNAGVIKTVLFDLDGTLADTAPDLAAALNQVLIENDREALPYERIRPEASYGGKGLIHLGFGLGPEDEEYDALRQRFLDLYADNICDYTHLFEGIDAVLADIEDRDMNWGIVTNKPAFLTDPLVAALGLDGRAACVVSGDTTANSKPHPEPLLHACALAGSEAHECVYVGDAERDIHAGQAAGMRTMAALFGYIRAEDDPERWGANVCIDTPGDISEYLDEWSDDND